MKKFILCVLSLIILLLALLVGGCNRQSGFTIEYKLNGGRFLDNANVYYHYYEDSGEITLPIPKRIGYKFVGWQQGDEEPQLEVKFNSSDCENKKFVAVWQQKSYVVKLNLTYKLEYNGEMRNVECTYYDSNMTSPSGFVVLYDDRIRSLGEAPPINYDAYSFSHWEWIKGNEKVRITSSTIFNEKIFGEQTEIVLNVVCISNFTPIS